MNRKVLLAMVLILGILIGYPIGIASGIHMTIKAGISILPMFTNITIKEEVVKDALFNYQDKIKACYGGQNAFIRNNTRN